MIHITATNTETHITFSGQTPDDIHFLREELPQNGISFTDQERRIIISRANLKDDEIAPAQEKWSYLLQEAESASQSHEHFCAQSSCWCHLPLGGEE